MRTQSTAFNDFLSVANDQEIARGVVVVIPLLCSFT